MECLDWTKWNSQLGCPSATTKLWNALQTTFESALTIDGAGSWRCASQCCLKEFLLDALLSQALLNSRWPCNDSQQDREGTFLMCPSTTSVTGAKEAKEWLVPETKFHHCDWCSKARLLFMRNKCLWLAEPPFSDYETKLLELTYWTGWETPTLSPIDL